MFKEIMKVTCSLLAFVAFVNLTIFFLVADTTNIWMRLAGFAAGAALSLGMFTLLMIKFTDIEEK